jgi:hypothetical protein
MLTQGGIGGISAWARYPRAHPANGIRHVDFAGWARHFVPTRANQKRRSMTVSAGYPRGHDNPVPTLRTAYGTLIL